MYSSTDLAKMFGTTKVTINRKFKDKSLSEFLVQTRSKNNGKIGFMLKQEGLNHFQLLMSESKVCKKVPTKSDSVANTVTTPILEDSNDTKKEITNDDSNNIQGEYINNLKEQIQKQYEQIEYLKNQIEKKDTLIEKQIVLAEHSQKQLIDSQEKLLLIESQEKTEKKNIFKRIFSGKNTK